MTEYVIREVGSRQWLVFADRRCIAFCADENEAVKAMNGHSARTRRDEIAAQAALGSEHSVSPASIEVPFSAPTSHSVPQAIGPSTS
ncbi:hypothetical protein NLM33_05805 [Bradyrhizobium sp. CCGUVB1N3]|uniref:hypothetical protein n=1 Tax=Bradyrhizobium sp. CCGUVB1N3 TaxID=2949629 RepID=UPI0020B1BCEA|nr:hypothetical protein [Bradyrhizobium sp. CCGUVB1N3]MCP3469843.1 hypothetical protein [Bradyrhizobium sp. CCGUVB1N3]